MNSILFYLTLNYVFTLYMVLVFGDIYSSPVEMENLIKLQKSMSERLKTYTLLEMDKISHIRRYLKDLKEQHSKAIADKHAYTNNPMNRFLLIKRLTSDLEVVRTHIDLQPFFKWNISATYPTTEDVTAVAYTVGQLQLHYLLNVQQLAAGNLKGYNSTSMSSSDCYELGRVLYEDYNYEAAADWLLQAYHMVDVAEKKNNPTYVAMIVEALCYAYISLDDKKNIKKWFRNLKNLNVSSEYTSSVKNHLKKKRDFKKNIDPLEIEFHENVTRDCGRLCRGEMQAAPEIQRRLKCKYLMNKPFLKLAPLKMEQLYIKPDVYMFYDVISDTEIEKIKSAGYPTLARSRTIKNTTTVTSNERISFTTWLSTARRVIKKVYSRVEDMTGLSTASAEKFQLALYPPGGHYKAHVDGSSNGTVRRGYRIATVLFYLSDVKEGGATVFIFLGVSVFPVKGAALFWQNTHGSGEPHKNTLHSACPVLIGYKWAANVWLNSKGQEFLHPCEIGGEKINESLHPPVWKLAGSYS